MRLTEQGDSWKCSCGTTVWYAPPRSDEDPEEDLDVIELDGVVHSHEEDDDIW